MGPPRPPTLQRRRVGRPAGVAASSDLWLMERVTVPFRVGTTVSDMTTQHSARGVVRIESSRLVVEFRETTVDLVTLKTTEGPVREVRIPMEDVESAEIGRRWPWGGTLCIRVRKLASAAGVPGAAGNELRFRVRRRDHDRARELCVATALMLAGEDIRRLEGNGGGS